MTDLQIAITPDFLKAFSKIPKSQQKKVREFTEKFRANPTSSGINYEKIVNFRDPKVRSVRIDDTYRAIVVKPPKGNVYLCVWVDHHDEAYAWAQNRCFEVNPRIGHLQVYEMSETVNEAIQEAEAAPALSEPRLLDEVDDDTLQAFGVMPALMPAVRGLKDNTQLEELARYLPGDVADALYLLAGGMSPEEVLNEVGRASVKAQPSAPVDTEDFAAALEKPESRRDFAVVDQHQLAEALTAPLEQWRIFLHPDQQKLVEWDVNGPIRVLGGAGTGKTVALLHRAAFLAGKLEPEERMLITTFTANLALELKSQLKKICSTNLDRIEITHLSAWAVNYLRSQRIKLKIANGKQMEDAWSVALEGEELDLHQKFYEDEWRRVVQAQDVVSMREYFKASRKGRGTRLSREQKAKVWECFERYRAELTRQGLSEWDDATREARIKLESYGGTPLYRYVLADEIQDFRDADLRLLRKLAPEDKNDLFLVGDPHQRIYGARANLSRSGIFIRGRSRRLKVNYRTTAEIGNWATALLTGRVYDDMDDGADSLSGYHAVRNGPRPIARSFLKESDETDFVLQTVKAWLAEEGVEPSHICVTTRSKKWLVGRYQAALENAGIATVILDKEHPEDTLDKGAVRLATMHRMKGLEFPRVILASADLVPVHSDMFYDQAAGQDHDMQELSLRYVAATRARDVLAVCGFTDQVWWEPLESQT